MRGGGFCEVYSVHVTVDSIQGEYQQEAQKSSPNLPKIGNKLRQKFERLLYELSKILMVGGVEESDKILSLILNSQNIYLKNKKNSHDLVNEITAITTNLHHVQTKINEYKLDTLPNIKEILRTLKLYRKVTMHSLSHGQTGQHNWSPKEIQQTLILLKKLETNIKDLTANTTN